MDFSCFDFSIIEGDCGGVGVVGGLGGGDEEGIDDDLGLIMMCSDFSDLIG